MSEMGDDLHLRELGRCAVDGAVTVAAREVN